MSAEGSGDPARRVRIRWGGGGAVVGSIAGLVAGLLLAGNLTWVGVGAVAAVAAVAVAVVAQVLMHSDRLYGRAKDERDRQERAESAARSRAREEQRVRGEATTVRLNVFGGGGVVDGAFVNCQQLRFQLSNGSRLPISDIDVVVEPSVEFSKLSGDRPVSLAGGGAASWWQDTNPFPIPADQASGQPLRSRAAVLTFTLDGRTWRTRTGSPPELIRGAMPGLD